MRIPGGALLAAMLAPVPAHAWGREGHRIVADVAERHLTPAARRSVQALLAVEGVDSLADVASWADEVRRSQPWTAHWHYVDIPVEDDAPPADYQPDRDCPRGDCIVYQLDAHEAVLADPHRPPVERLEALKWVVHLVADLHQPLHCADHGDRGGNQVRVRLGTRTSTLHAVWDVGLLEQTGMADLAVAARLDDGISRGDIARWNRGTTVDWARESYGVARSVIYGSLPHAAGDLGPDYEPRALPTVDAQLSRAGVRLAAVLNARLHGP